MPRAVVPDSLHIDHIRIECRDFTMPRLQLKDRRSTSAPLLLFVYQRHLERVLYNRSEGGSTGAIWKLLNASGLGRTALQVNSAAVDMGEVT